jgi:hypothetical protein
MTLKVTLQATLEALETGQTVTFSGDLTIRPKTKEWTDNGLSVNLALHATRATSYDLTTPRTKNAKGMKQITPMTNIMTMPATSIGEAKQSAGNTMTETSPENNIGCFCMGRDARPTNKLSHPTVFPDPHTPPQISLHQNQPRNRSAIARVGCNSPGWQGHPSSHANWARPVLSTSGWTVYCVAMICLAQSAARSSSPSFSGPSVPSTKNPSGGIISSPPFFSSLSEIGLAA